MSEWRMYVESLKELVLERVKKRYPEPTFVDAAGVLAEVINEEIDAGFDFSDEQLEQIATVLDGFDDNSGEVPVEFSLDTWKDRV